MKGTLFTLAALLQVGMAAAAWYDEYPGNDSFEDGGASFSDPATDTFTDNTVPTLDEMYGPATAGDAFGVDPLYSTPSRPARAEEHQRAGIPNDVYFEMFGNMTLTDQSAHVHVCSAYVGMALTNPQKVALWGWHMHGNASLRATWISTTGEKLLDVNRLYAVNLNLGLSHKLGQRAQVQFGGLSQFSSDSDTLSNDNFIWGCYAALSIMPTEYFQLTLGAAYVPEFYHYDFFPMVNLAWRYNPNWEMRIQGSRLSTVRIASDMFQWGPFVQWHSSLWTVRRHTRYEQFRQSGVIAGLGVFYNHPTNSPAKVRFVGDVGCTLYNTFRVRDRKGRHTLERYRCHQGLYIRAGIQIYF